MMSRVTTRSRLGRRRGLVSVVVLIALIIIVMVCAGLFKVALGRRARVQAEERRVQAAWLAESGLDRASARLASSIEYAGETWEVPASDLGGRGPGTVVIQVEKPLDRPESRKVKVQADFPANSNLRSRVTRESFFPIPHPSR